VGAVRRTFRAVAERDGAWWAIRVEGLPGVYTQARRLGDVEGMARDAIALILDAEPDSFDVAAKPALGDDVAALVAEARAARLEAERAARRSSEQLRAAVARLATSGLTVRDIAHLLGLSHQRVAQVTGRGRPRRVVGD